MSLKEIVTVEHIT